MSTYHTQATVTEGERLYPGTCNAFHFNESAGAEVTLSRALVRDADYPVHKGGSGGRPTLKSLPHTLCPLLCVRGSTPLPTITTRVATCSQSPRECLPEACVGSCSPPHPPGPHLAEGHGSLQGRLVSPRQGSLPPDLLLLAALGTRKPENQVS